MQEGKDFSSALQTLFLNVLKGSLGEKQMTTKWAVLRECATFSQWAPTAAVLLESCSQAAVRSGGAISMNDVSADSGYRLQGVWRKTESVDPRGDNTIT
eukprot:scaffold23755_cov20-Tisochrysis_lutea.AAC.1